MKTVLLTSDRSDHELLSLSLQGECDAFGKLVARYQSLICAQAYSVCGDIGRSEDVAQETFVSAWRQLPSLRDHSKFRPWLCGIARHLAFRVAEQRRREAAVASQAVSSTRGSVTPRETAISHEEEMLVWGALEELPETYRTTLVLYYREQQSIRGVADALDLSEDAVKQRLARGRSMLRQQVTSLVETTLRTSSPGATFTATVVAAVAAAAPASASAGTIAAAAAKGSGSMKLLLSIPVLGGLLGAAVGLLGGWFGVKVSAENAAYERERQAIFAGSKRIGMAVIALLLMQGVAAGLGILTGNMALAALLFAAAVLGYVVWLLLEIVSQNRKLQRIREEEAAAGTPLRPSSGAWSKWVPTGLIEYRSRASFFGWPLVHVVWNSGNTVQAQRITAKGWIAIGDRSFGFLSFGSVATGVFAMGGVAVGGFAFGGVGLGAVTFGGLALGLLAYGGLAMGILAHGGLAIATKAALGGCAIAYRFAVGGAVTAAHANDATAQAALREMTWFQLTTQPWLTAVIWSGAAVLFIAVSVLSTYLSRKQAMKSKDSAEQ